MIPKPMEHLRDLSPGQLADEAGRLKAALGDIKAEAVRSELTRAEGNFFRLTLSPPGRQMRFDRKRFEADNGTERLAPYLYEEDTSWVMRLAARRL